MMAKLNGPQGLAPATDGADYSVPAPAVNSFPGLFQAIPGA
jgi:hypothetical protein